MHDAPSHPIFDVPIVDVSMDQAADCLEQLASADGPAQAVYFANAHTLELARKEGAYRDVLCRGARVFGDGVGVRLAMRWLHQVELQANVNGTDLIPLWMERDKGHRVFLLGTHPDRVQAAAEHVRSTWPHWTVVGAHHGYFSDEQERMVVEAVTEARPDVLLVGMGNPRQEQFIDRYQQAMGASLCIGVGALLDYWAGAQRRAPRFLRERGLEWGFRMVFHRGKLGRYTAGSARFLAAVARRR